MDKPSIYSSKNILAPIFMFIVLIIEMEIIDNLFPYPGFKAIISLPLIYGICSIVIITGIYLTRKLNFIARTAIWFIVFIVNSLIIFQLYPQQIGPTVLKRIGYTYNVINNYDTITEEDLELYVENEYDPFDKSVPDDKERYVAALYKFRNEINRDSSFFLYGQKDKPIIGNTNIKKHIENGQHSLIWWMLETFKTDN